MKICVHQRQKVKVVLFSVAIFVREDATIFGFFSQAVQDF